MIHPFAVVHPDAHLGPGTVVDPFAVIEHDVWVGRDSHIGYGSLLRGQLIAGNNFRVGFNTNIEGVTRAGNDVKIHGHCELCNTTFGNRVRVYGGCIMYDTRNLAGGETERITLEDDVILGCHVSICGGVTVGACSVVAARAVVKADVPPDSYVKTDGTVVPRR